MGYESVNRAKWNLLLFSTRSPGRYVWHQGPHYSGWSCGSRARGCLPGGERNLHYGSYTAKWPRNSVQTSANFATCQACVAMTRLACRSHGPSCNDRCHQENFRYWLQYPILNADQWKLAELPITSGGLAFPNLHRQAVVARIACLATLPEFVVTDPYKAATIDKERPELFGRFGPLIGPTPMEVVEDLHSPPLGKNFTRLSKKFSRFHFALCCNERWAKGMICPPRCVMPGCTTCQAVNRPSPRGFRAKVRGFDASPEILPPHFLIACSVGAYNNVEGAPRRALDTHAHGQAVALNLTPFMLPLAIRTRYARGMTDFVTTSPLPPARRGWQRWLNRAWPLKRTLQEMSAASTGQTSGLWKRQSPALGGCQSHDRQT